MKTPREVILEQHRHQEERLKTISAEQLAACAREALEKAAPLARANFSAASLVIRFWTEAILPWRRVWLGFAAVWLGILALNLVLNQGPVTVTRMSREAEADPQVKTALREQRQLLAQLLGPVGPPPKSLPALPGPRSDLRVEQVMV